MSGSDLEDWFIVQQELPDGSVTPYQIFTPETVAAADTPRDAAAPAASAPAPRGIVMIWPGFGMAARYYRPMARELARRGFWSVIAELHSQGGQTAVASRKSNWGYHDLASVDYPYAIALARREYARQYALSTADSETVPVYLLCHSMGGQIATLYLSRPEADVDAVMMVGSGVPHYRNFSGKHRNRLLFGAPAMRLGAHLWGYWPGGRFDPAGFGRQAGYQVREWARFALTGRLLPKHTDFDYEQAIGQVTTPVLITTCNGDYDCPPKSAQDLAARLHRAAKFEFIEQRLGHNRWAREPETVANRFEQFLTELPTWNPQS